MTLTAAQRLTLVITLSSRSSRSTSRRALRLQPSRYRNLRLDTAPDTPYDRGVEERGALKPFTRHISYGHRAMYLGPAALMILNITD